MRRQANSVPYCCAVFHFSTSMFACVHVHGRVSGFTLPGSPRGCCGLVAPSLTRGGLRGPNRSAIVRLGKALQDALRNCHCEKTWSAVSALSFSSEGGGVVSDWRGAAYLHQASRVPLSAARVSPDGIVADASSHDSNGGSASSSLHL